MACSISAVVSEPVARGPLVSIHRYETDSYSVNNYRACIFFSDVGMHFVWILSGAAPMRQF